MKDAIKALRPFKNDVGVPMSYQPSFHFHMFFECRISGEKICCICGYSEPWPEGREELERELLMETIKRSWGTV